MLQLFWMFAAHSADIWMGALLLMDGEIKRDLSLMSIPECAARLFEIIYVDKWKCAVTWSLASPPPAQCGKQTGAVLFSRVSTVEACSWIEATVEVPPHGAKGKRGGKERAEEGLSGEWWKRGQQREDSVATDRKRGTKNIVGGEWSGDSDGDGVVEGGCQAMTSALMSWPTIELNLVWKQSERL